MLATENESCVELTRPEVTLTGCGLEAIMPLGFVVLSETDPANPLMLVNDTVELAPEAADSLIGLGLADILNPVIDVLPMNVDQHDPNDWQDPVELL